MMTLFDNDQIMRAYTREKIEEGWRKGEIEGRKEVARNMLHESMPVDMIVRISGLSSDEVNALAAQTLT